MNNKTKPFNLAAGMLFFSLFCAAQQKNTAMDTNGGSTSGSYTQAPLAAPQTIAGAPVLKPGEPDNMGVGAPTVTAAQSLQPPPVQHAAALKAGSLDANGAVVHTANTAKTATENRGINQQGEKMPAPPVHQSNTYSNVYKEGPRKGQPIFATAPKTAVTPTPAQQAAEKAIIEKRNAGAHLTNTTAAEKAAYQARRQAELDAHRKK